METLPKILLVDDRKENLIALEVALKGMPVHLVKAISGNEALKATLHHDFALALLDIQMPEMDGYELAGILREEEKTNRLPFIFISAVYTDNLNIFKGYEKGAFSFITKPFNPDLLINKVQFFLDIYNQELAVQQLNEELRKRNAELETANKDLESFSYSVSHDLRTPLRAISNFTSLLKAEYGDTLNEDGNELLAGVKRNAEKMGSLINDLLEFSRTGKAAVRKNMVNMTELVETALTEINKAIKHNAEIKIYPLQPVKADSALLMQVFSNLLSNAIKYSSKVDKPCIEVSSKVHNSDIIYTVKDNGAGFDMQYASKLFNVFQRLHSQAEFDGTGVGLAIVDRIIKKHGGRIWAEGKVGEGATFHFSLPNAENN